MLRPPDNTPLPESLPSEPAAPPAVSAATGRRTSFEANETSRVETFSDSVFAIAATLLVLTLHVPATHASDGAVWHQLLAHWPTDVAFVISFLSILIMWSNHHGVFNVIQRVDHTFLLLNGLLLLGITTTPFTTTLLADNLGHASERVGALIYSGVLLFVSIAFVGLWLYASRGRRLLAAGITDAHIRAHQTVCLWPRGLCDRLWSGLCERQGQRRRAHRDRGLLRRALARHARHHARLTGPLRRAPRVLSLLRPAARAPVSFQAGRPAGCRHPGRSARQAWRDRPSTARRRRRRPADRAGYRRAARRRRTRQGL
jgi:uncharacterized membrane protein